MDLDPGSLINRQSLNSILQKLELDPGALINRPSLNPILQKLDLDLFLFYLDLYPGF